MIYKPSHFFEKNKWARRDSQHTFAVAYFSVRVFARLPAQKGAFEPATPRFILSSDPETFMDPSHAFNVFAEAFLKLQ
jgi:hypothetical protein